MNKKRTMPRPRVLANVPVVISTKEAAALLNISQSMVRKLCEEGKLPAEKFGKLWRIEKSATMKLFEKGY